MRTWTRTVRGRIAATTVAVTLGAVLASCGSAEPQRNLMWYCSADPANCEAAIEGFSEVAPDIAVEYLRLPSGQLAARYLEERAAGTAVADVASVADRQFYDENAGLFEQIGPDDVPALASWPAEHVLHGRAAVVGMHFNVVGYNTDLVAPVDVPRTWEDLLDPRFAGGRIGYGDPRVGAAFMELAKVWNDELGPDYLARFAGQDVVVSDSVVAASQRMAAGEFSLVLPNLVSVVDALKEQGAPVDWVAIEPVSGPEYFAAISTGAANEVEAREFVNYLLTPQGQAALNAGVGSSPLGAAVPEALQLPAGYRVPDPAGTTAAADELLTGLGLR
jgi:iron(III) transport system substrate-binding protein